MLFPRDKLALFIGLRYSFSRQRNRFIGVVSMVSLLGMTLGVASLITVLSVMNGFGGELRNRILALVPHIQVLAREDSLPDWRSVAHQLQKNSEIVSVAPFIESKVMLAGERDVRGARLTAVEPQLEGGVSQVAQHMVSGEFQALAEQRYGVVMGTLLARSLGLQLGDNIEITIPRLTTTPLGTFPRSKRFRLVGLFEVGAQLDGSQVYISLAAGQALFSLGDGVHGLRVRTRDLYSAPQIAAALQQQLGAGYNVKDWGDSQGSLFSAVRMEKTMITVLLLSVVAVAAFNIVSTLIMAVTDKRGDIAVLRTMGARASTVMAIFIAHGLALSCAGVIAGVLCGVALALNISEVTLLLEQLLGVKLFDPQVYFISDLPSDLQWGDVGLIAGLSLLLGLLATLFPAWRASQVAPAEVLRYE